MSTYLSILSSEYIKKKNLIEILKHSTEKNKAKVFDRQTMYEDGTLETSLGRNDLSFVITLDSKELYDTTENDYKEYNFYKNLGTKYGSTITIIVGQIEDSILLNDFLKSLFEDNPELLFLNDEVDGDPYVFSASQIITAVNNASKIPFHANDWMWEPPVEEGIV